MILLTGIHFISLFRMVKKSAILRNARLCCIVSGASKHAYHAAITGYDRHTVAATILHHTLVVLVVHLIAIFVVAIS